MTNPPPTVARPWPRGAIAVVIVGVTVACWALIFYGNAIGVALGIHGALAGGGARLLLVAALQVIAGFIIGRPWALLIAVIPAGFLLTKNTADGMHGIDWAPFFVAPSLGLTALGVILRRSVTRPSDAGNTGTAPRPE